MTRQMSTAFRDAFSSLERVSAVEEDDEYFLDEHGVEVTDGGSLFPIFISTARHK